MNPSTDSCFIKDRNMHESSFSKPRRMTSIAVEVGYTYIAHFSGVPEAFRCCSECASETNSSAPRPRRRSEGVSGRRFSKVASSDAAGSSKLRPALDDFVSSCRPFECSSRTARVGYGCQPGPERVGFAEFVRESGERRNVQPAENRPVGKIRLARQLSRISPRTSEFSAAARPLRPLAPAVRSN